MNTLNINQGPEGVKTAPKKPLQRLASLAGRASSVAVLALAAAGCWGPHGGDRIQGMADAGYSRPDSSSPDNDNGGQTDDHGYTPNICEGQSGEQMPQTQVDESCVGEVPATQAFVADVPFSGAVAWKNPGETGFATQAFQSMERDGSHVMPVNPEDPNQDAGFIVPSELGRGVRASAARFEAEGTLKAAYIVSATGSLDGATDRWPSKVFVMANDCGKTPAQIAEDFAAGNTSQYLGKFYEIGGNQNDELRDIQIPAGAVVIHLFHLPSPDCTEGIIYSANEIQDQTHEKVESITA